MSNKFDMVSEAVAEAKQTFTAVGSFANQMAQLLPGHLRRVDGGALEKLKRELRDFNMKTYKWRRRK